LMLVDPVSGQTRAMSCPVLDRYDSDSRPRASGPGTGVDVGQVCFVEQIETGTPVFFLEQIETGTRACRAPGERRRRSRPRWGWTP